MRLGGEMKVLTNLLWFEAERRVCFAAIGGSSRWSFGGSKTSWGSLILPVVIRRALFDSCAVRVGPAGALQSEGGLWPEATLARTTGGHARGNDLSLGVDVGRRMSRWKTVVA